MPLNDIIHTTTAVKHSRTFSEPKELVTRGKNILYTSRENISWTLKGIKRIVPIPCHPTLVRTQMVLPFPPALFGQTLANLWGVFPRLRYIQPRIPELSKRGK